MTEGIYDITTGNKVEDAISPEIQALIDTINSIYPFTK